MRARRTAANASLMGQGCARAGLSNAPASTGSWPRHVASPAHYLFTSVRSLAWRLLLVGWPGTRVFKTALATALAWLAGNAFGDPAPMFAVFGALNGMQPTVAASARSILGGLLGIVLGTLLAATSEGLVHAPQAVLGGVLVGLGLVARVRLHVYELLGTEVAVSGVVVYALSGGSLLL